MSESLAVVEQGAVALAGLPAGSAGADVAWRAGGAPLVSIIVRSIGRASVDMALESVALQSYRPIEIVLVDAAGDSQRAWPPEWAGVALRVPDTGGRPRLRAAAANFGLDQARGELALFLDDDDLLLPDHLCRLQAALAAAPAAPAAFADTDFGYPTEDGWHSLHRFEGGFDPVRLRFENYLPIHSVLFRHAPGTPRIDEAFDLFEDWDFWLQMAQLGDFVHLPGISARYVAAEGQRSGVLIDSPATQQARLQLLTKWQTASTAHGHAMLIDRMQRLYREHAQGQAALAAGGDAQAHQQRVIAARGTEIAAALQQTSGLQDILAARERELVESARHARGLTDLVSAREAESAEAARHAQALAAVVAARDDALADAGRHVQALTALVAAREDALASAEKHSAALTDLVVIRVREWAAAAAYADDLKQHLSVRDNEVAAAAAERQSLLHEIHLREREVAALRLESESLRRALQDHLAQPPLRALVQAVRRRWKRTPA